MALPEIDFARIRPHGGSKSSGFEELCCQLASLEPRSLGDEFFRKGLGADAGVECFLQRADGTQIAWQAKYLFNWNQGLVNQLNGSIETALEKHPNISLYVVCLPFNLPDARLESTKSALQKWLEWRQDWLDKICSDRELEISLWGSSEIVERLTRDDPKYSGRILYWFGQEYFTSAWFSAKFEQSKTSLGNRYTPETNIRLPIRRDFLAFARAAPLQRQIDNWFLQIRESGDQSLSAIAELASGNPQPHSSALSDSLDALVSLLSVPPIGIDQSYPIVDWIDATSNCYRSACEALYWASEQPTAFVPYQTDPSFWAQSHLRKLADMLYEVRLSLNSNRWKIANANAVLLHGPGGVGKSHLLADIVEYHVSQGNPALLLLGEKFVDTELWPQIRDQLDRPGTEQFRHFLGSLDAAAQSTGVRAVLCIDALNERHGLDVWPTRLAGFLAVADEFPHVNIVLSCQSVYLRQVVPSGLSSEQLFPIEHRGFAPTGGEAAKTYLDLRGIARPGAPELVPEFNSPFFLKTFCDALEKEEATEFPRGLRGVTSIFGFYRNAIVQSLNRRMQLDTRLNIVPKAIGAFSELLLNDQSGYVRKTDAIELFESILPSGGDLRQSLLSQMTSEGLLTVEPLPQNDGTTEEMVRYTFQRFSDHMLARQVLDKHINEQDVMASFQPEGFLHKFLTGDGRHVRAGIIHAIAIQLPECTGVEILDVLDKPPAMIHRAFQNSLLWRDPSRFTEHTYSMLEARLRPEALNDILVSVSTEPSNQFNADYLHERLWNITMPDRDASWSAYLTRRGYSGPVETHIEWAIEAGLEEIGSQRARLAAMTLTWFFSCSHREVRDKATKALTCLLVHRLDLAARLVREFARVNDPYVLERLLAACYGAVLYADDGPSLAELAATVFGSFFADRDAPVHILSRDYARCIVDYAAMQGQIDTHIDLNMARPPYRSQWPIADVPDEFISSYSEVRSDVRVGDQIVYSTVNDGDFARYVIDPAVSKWSTAVIDTARALETAEPTSESCDSAREYLRAIRGSERYPPLARFSVQNARRWICKRAHDLGWTPGVFGDLDEQLGRHDRSDHRVERIGKKYQWIAFNELLARMSDNLVYAGSPLDHDPDRREPYRDACRLGLRNIDPSLLLTRSHYDGWREWDKTWWVPEVPELRTMSPTERIVWLESENDFFRQKELIELCQPDTQSNWLGLQGFSSWKGYGISAGRRVVQREAWFRLTCVVTKKGDLPLLLKALSVKRVLTNPSHLPNLQIRSHIYLREYPWHQDLDQLQADCHALVDWASEMDIRPTVATYSCTSGGYDYSVDKTIDIHLPAPWLCQLADLRANRSHAPTFSRCDGRVIFFDTSLLYPGPATALIDRDAFIETLDREGLAPVWILAGEKNVYGGAKFSAAFGGSVRYTSIYSLGSEKRLVECGRSMEKISPTTEQIKEFFEGQPVPTGIVTRD